MIMNENERIWDYMRFRFQECAGGLIDLSGTNQEDISVLWSKEFLDDH